MEITRALKAMVQLKAAQYNYFSEYVAVNEDDEYAREQVQHLDHEIIGIKECAEAMTGRDFSLEYSTIDTESFDLVVIKVTLGDTVLYRR